MDLRHPDSKKCLEGSSGSNGPSVAVRVLEESKIVCLNILLEHIYNSFGDMGSHGSICQFFISQAQTSTNSKTFCIRMTCVYGQLIIENKNLVK